ncbi:hypothetical protein BN1263320051 [Stenotrophomonas indicatrix]|nr:hypothetical protein BN1263320051 [Stenotrophomonas indicatrix]
MQALTYHGRKDVRVETVPDPVLAADDDLILRVTATAICGSDLHLYRGKIPDLHSGTFSAMSSWAWWKRWARVSPRFAPATGW